MRKKCQESDLSDDKTSMFIYLNQAKQTMLNTLHWCAARQQTFLENPH